MAHSLIADIGATNARFQLCGNGDLLGEPLILETAAYTSVEALLQQVRVHLNCAEVKRGLFAVAGPADQAGNITVTNTGLVFDAAVCTSQVGAEVELVNDFFALAHGVPYFSELTQLGGTTPLEGGNKALLGPGSGLGMATIVPSGGGWQVIASEGGHADLAVGSALEAELWQLLTQQHGHVCWETVLCGPGLQHLYQAMCGVWGAAAEALSPAQITERGCSLQDPVCHQTMESFCGLLGSAAGNLALTVTAAGGVYIGGGIVPQMLDFVRTSPLRRRFEERGDLSDYISGIPLYVITDNHPGLMAALHCLRSRAGLA